jgi:hypothetical protein
VKELLDHYKIPLYYETSAKSNIKIIECFTGVIEKVLERNPAVSQMVNSSPSPSIIPKNLKSTKSKAGKCFCF